MHAPTANTMSHTTKNHRRREPLHTRANAHGNHGHWPTRTQLHNHSRQACPKRAARRRKVAQHICIVPCKANWARARSSVPGGRATRHTRCVDGPTLRASCTEIPCAFFARPRSGTLRRPSLLGSKRQTPKAPRPASTWPFIRTQWGAKSPTDLRETGWAQLRIITVAKQQVAG